MAILDEAAGKTHSAEGSVRTTLAQILNRYDLLVDDLASEELARSLGAFRCWFDS